MGFLAASTSLFSNLADALKPRHSWHYDELRDVRTCTCCGLQEEMVVDLVSSDWQTLVPGDEAAHARKKAAAKPELKVEADLLAAPTSQNPS